jgi:DNA-binding XRE family transcriptional regulator
MSLSYATVCKKVVVAQQPNTDKLSRYSKDKLSILIENDLEDRDVPSKAKKPSGKQHDRLIAARREFGISQDEFAKRAGVSKKDIGECETGKITIPPVMWNKVDAAITTIRREKAKQAEAVAKAAKDYNKILREQKSAKLAAANDTA